MVTQVNSALSANRFYPLITSCLVIVYLYLFVGARPAIATGLGVALGISLYHAAFGFTSAWRRFLTDRWGAGLKVQIIMLAVAVTLFFPVLDSGVIFGYRAGGFVAPAGTGVVVGAFIFGIGMQISGGCASGTLFTVGGGSIRMLVTLVTFMLGSVIATLNLPFWHSLPKLKPISLVSLWGWELALLLHLVIFLGLYLFIHRIEKKDPDPGPDPDFAAQNRRSLINFSGRELGVRLIQGPWPLILGGLALAFLNFAMLATLGHPWGITSGITLWGGKLVTFFGADLSDIPYWTGRMAAIDRSLFRSDSSATNIGIIAGAMSAAFLAGKFGKSQNVNAKGIITSNSNYGTIVMVFGYHVFKEPQVLAILEIEISVNYWVSAIIRIAGIITALIGGLMLGYGARLAYGCNIGAFFSGVASGSLHGWVWLVAALAGNLIGVRVRKLISL